MCAAVHRGPPVLRVLRVLWILRVLLLAAADTLDRTHRDAPELTCSEGLAHCRLSSGSSFPEALPDPRGPLTVSQLKLKVVLCCSEKQDCVLCLQIVVSLREISAGEGFSGESGDDSDEERTKQLAEGSVNLCLSSPATADRCKALQFEWASSGRASQQSTHELLLTEKVNFESPVVVRAYSKGGLIFQNISVPSLLEVCSMRLDGSLKKCEVPRLRVMTGDLRNYSTIGEFFLRLENTDARKDALRWQMVWNDNAGEVLTWPRNKSEVVIPSHLIVPCLCFKVWWTGSDLQGKYCPFNSQQDALQRMWHNVTVSLEESGARGGLTWNVTAPCRLDAELWLCKMDPAGGHCEEVTGSRQKLLSDWRATRRGHWQAGEFNLSSQPLFCIQMQIKGMESYLEPHCPFTTSHSRWGLALLVALLLVFLAVLGAYFIQGILRGYVWRWLKEEDVKGAVGGGHVLLLYSPDDDRSLPGLLCHLGSSLQALGFSVSLDLWSQAELGMLGPVPWLHSRLDRLQRQGGKVVLVLTQATWTRAEEWGVRGWERSLARDKNVKEEEEEEEEGGGRSGPASSPCGDVFSASLSCILADYLQGRAGERFMLVQFESLPPEPPGSFRPLPQLFRGLHVYSLPSQSLGFLTELAGARQMATASARRKRAGGLRMASRTLAQKLSGFSAGANVLRLAGVSQSCVGAGLEDSGEMVPLQTCLITPPSSPDTDPRDSEVDWV
ncbi:uncharacterized protein LOC115408918 [Salarias fasciatus]|uniref:Uncharacterized LOC115408918 n=1 Tax=Salarias fasciatus TaxID=181472 RepID=A0A672IUN7_SALFA|nr:uncharacterized protein LOC115408918 [Salarias fasciatus]